MDAIKNKTKQEKLILLVLAVLALTYLGGLFRHFTAVGLLWLAAVIFLGWLLVEGGKAELFRYAFLVLSALALIDFFAGFSQGSYRLSAVYGETENAFTVLPGLLRLAGFLGIAALGGVKYASGFPALGDKLRQLWFLPALLLAVTLAYAVLLGLGVSFFGGSARWTGFDAFFNLPMLLWTAYALLLGLDTADAGSLPYRAASGTNAAPDEPRYYPVAKLLFLSFITLGVWALVWIWRVTAQLAAYEDKHARKSWHELIFCLLLPFYFIYWAYKSAKLLSQAEGKDGESFGVLCLACAALVPPVGMALIQDRLNAMADAAAEAAQGIEVELYEEESAPVAEDSTRAEEDEQAEEE